MDLKDTHAEKITWIDSATGSSTWELISDLEKIDLDPIEIFTFGIIIKETDTFVTVAQNYGTNPPQFSNTMSIPKGCIIKREKIEI